MRKRVRGLRVMCAAIALATAMTLLGTACGPKPQPHGPPPEYEEPPAPVWPLPAEAGAASSSGDAGARD